MEFDPGGLKIRERYALLISLIQPRPIAWVSTQDKSGRHNLAPFSFFTGAGSDPMTVCFCPARDREGGKKDSLLNIEETGEFVVNIVDESLAEKAVRTSKELPRGESEFEDAGLTPAPSSVVKAPRVLESPAAFECRLLKTVELGKGPAGGTVVIGEVLRVHIADALWKDGGVSHKDLKPVGRLEGDWYARATDDLCIPRPGKG